MRTLLLLLSLAGMILTSCEVSHYKAVNATFKNGELASYKMVEEPLIQIGGTRTTHRADGSSTTTDYQVSFQQFCQLAGVAVANWSSVAINKANNLYNQFREGQITQRQATAGLLELQKAELGNSGQVIEPGGSVLNQGQILSAPVLP